MVTDSNTNDKKNKSKRNMNQLNNMFNNHQEETKVIQKVKVDLEEPIASMERNLIIEEFLMRKNDESSDNYSLSASDDEQETDAVNEALILLNAIKKEKTHAMPMKKSHIEYELERQEVWNDPQSKPDYFLLVQEQDQFEKIQTYFDIFPFLEIRKIIMQIKCFISYLCQRVVTSKVFEAITLTIILINSITLAMDDPTTDVNSETMEVIEAIFLGFYTLEMLLKIFAYGLIMNKGSYLRDSWNIMDFVVIVTAYLPYVMNSAAFNLQSLRSLRVLRPLKTVSKIKALKQIIQALFSAIPMLVDSIIILVFFYLIFSIAGLQLFMGKLKYRCIMTNTGIIQQTNLPVDGNPFCIDDESCPQTPKTHYCGKNWNNNPDYGQVNFDTFLYSFIMVFVSITLEGWSEIMFNLERTVSYWIWILFVFMTFAGAFFIVNLVISIISVKFSEAQNDNQQNFDTEEIEDTDWPIEHLRNLKILPSKINMRKKLLFQEKIIQQQRAKLMKQFSLKNIRTKLSQLFCMSTSVKIHHTSMEYINSGIEMKNYETDNDESNAKSKEKADEFLISDDDEEIQNNQKTTNTPIQSIGQDKVQNMMAVTKVSTIVHQQRKSIFQQSIMPKQDNPNKTLNNEDPNVFFESVQKIEPAVRNQAIKRSITIHDLKKKDDKKQIKQQKKEIIRKKSLSSNESKDTFEISFDEKDNKFTTKAPILNQLHQDDDFKVYDHDQFTTSQPKVVDSEKKKNKKTIAIPHSLQVLQNKQLEINIDQFENEEEFFKNEALKKKLMPIKNQLKINIDNIKVFQSQSELDVIPSKKLREIEQQKLCDQLQFYNASFQFVNYVPEQYFQDDRQPDLDYLQQFQIDNKQVVVDSLNIEQSVMYKKIAQTYNYEYKGIKLPVNDVEKQQFKKLRIPKKLQQQKMLLSQQSQIQLATSGGGGGKKRRKRKYGQNIQNEDQIFPSLLDAKVMITTDPEQEEIDQKIQKNNNFDCQQDFYDLRKQIIAKIGQQLNVPCSLMDIYQLHPKQNKIEYDVYFDRFTRIIEKMNYVPKDYEMWETGLIGLQEGIRRRFFYFATSNFVDKFIMLCVMLNTVVMSVDNMWTDPLALDILTLLNTIFSYIFIAEMFTKIIGMGPLGYCRDKMNLFDGFLVSISLVEIIFSTGGGVSAFRSIRIFRTFRVLRVGRLIRSLEYMKIIMAVMAQSYEGIGYISLLNFLFIYIYALLGMSIYGGSFTPEIQAQGRANFDSFNDSFMAIFQIITLENWNGIIYMCLQTDIGTGITLFYFLSWIILGNYTLLNLFLAILLEGFGAESTFDDHIVPDIELQIQEEVELVDLEKQQEQNKDIDSDDEAFQKEEEEKKKKKYVWFDGIECEECLFLFNKENKFRRACYKAVKDPRFDNFILYIIIISSFKLVVDTYIPDDPNQQNAQQKLIFDISLNMDILFTAIFTVELLTKVIAYGFIMDENSYMTDSWSQMDFVIVFFSLVDLALTGYNLAFIKIVRLLRILRPLRFISRNPSLKQVVIALMESLGGIANTVVVIGLIWLMFGILGMNLMTGKLGYCDGLDNYYNIGQTQCGQLNQADSKITWKTYDQNFNNIGITMLSLFELSTLENWPGIMSQFQDANDPESGPSFYNSSFMTLFFFVFIVVGSIFLINLFIGVISLNYNRAQEQVKSKALTNEQSKWIEMQQMITEVNFDYDGYKPPTDKLKILFYGFLKGTVFDLSIMLIIILNIFSMGMNYDGESKAYTNGLTYANLVFTAIFIFEMSIKMWCFSIKGYLSSSWNKFDTFVVTASIFDLIMEQIGSGVSFLAVGPQIARIFRVLRVTRLFKLVKSLKGLQRLIQTTLYAIPKLLNVTMLLFLVYFIFSVLGIFLFQNITEGRKIVPWSNFATWHSSIIFLYICSTGEDWQNAMFDTMITEGCQTGVNCGSTYNVLYWMMFTLATQFVMLNLFVLVILQEFEENYINPNNPLQSFDEWTELFKENWAIFTSKDEGLKLHSSKMIDFLMYLPKPLGLGWNDEIERKNLGDEEALFNRYKSEKKRYFNYILL